MTLDNKPVPAIVQQAEETEQQLISRAQEAMSANWVVGECAALWISKYANGKTDSDFAEMIGASQSQVNYARRVYETFADAYHSSGNLTWTHYREALAWSDASESLAKADDKGWSVAEMKHWRKSRNDTRSDEADTPSAKVRFPVEWIEAFPKLNNEHFIAAVGWKDREESLEAATENEWSVKDMVRWHKALSEPDDDTKEEVAEDESAEPERKESGEASEPSFAPSLESVIMSIRKIKKLISQIDASNIEGLGDEIMSLVRVYDSITDTSQKPAPKKKALPARFIKPSLEEVEEYCAELGSTVDPENFIDFYASKGWKVGSSPMKDWKAALRNWDKREKGVGTKQEPNRSAFDAVFGDRSSG